MVLGSAVPLVLVLVLQVLQRTGHVARFASPITSSSQSMSRTSHSTGSASPLHPVADWLRLELSVALSSSAVGVVVVVDVVDFVVVLASAMGSMAVDVAGVVATAEAGDDAEEDPPARRARS